MTTMQSHFGKDSVYFGKRGLWLVVCAMTRDAEIMEEVNYKAAARMLGITDIKTQKFPAGLAIERVSHWGCGWIDVLLIRPTAAKKKIKLAEQIVQRIEKGEVLDEDEYFSRCDEDAEEALAEEKNYLPKFGRNWLYTDAEDYFKRCLADVPLHLSNDEWQKAIDEALSEEVIEDFALNTDVGDDVDELGILARKVAEEYKKTLKDEGQLLLMEDA